MWYGYVKMKEKSQNVHSKIFHLFVLIIFLIKRDSFSSILTTKNMSASSCRNSKGSFIYLGRYENLSQGKNEWDIIPFVKKSPERRKRETQSFKLLDGVAKIMPWNY